MATLLNRVGVTTATAGTGTITLGSALAAGTSIFSCSFQTQTTAGAAGGQTLAYLILDSNGAWEYGQGTYTSSNTALTRTLGQSNTGSLLSLTGNAQVFLTARASDILNPVNNLSDVLNSSTALNNIGGLAKTANLSDVANSSAALDNIGGLAKTANLSDVSSAATALSNIGGAANNLAYVTIGNTAGLSAERALTAGTGITLTDGGANTTATVARASGGKILLNTLTASNSASLADTTSLTGTYKRYEIVFENLIHATVNGNFRFRYNQGGVQTTGYKGKALKSGTSSAVTTEIPLTVGLAGETTAPGYCGTIILDDPSANIKHVCYGTGLYNDSSAGALSAIIQAVGGWFDTAGVLTGFEVTSSVGNITSGTVKVYGIVN